MAKIVSASMDDDQVTYLKEMVESGEAGSISEAMRMEVGRGKPNTRLRRTVRRFADSSALLGVFWVGLTFFYPLELRGFAIPIFLIALSLYAADRAIAAYEPAVSRRLFGLFRGESA